MVRFCFRKKRRRGGKEEREEGRTGRKAGRMVDGSEGVREGKCEGGREQGKKGDRDLCALDGSQCVSGLRENWLHQAEIPHCRHTLHEKEAKVPIPIFKMGFFLRKEYR